MIFFCKNQVREEDKIRGIKYVPIFKIDFYDVYSNSEILSQKIKELNELDYKTPLLLENFLSPRPDLSIFPPIGLELLPLFGISPQLFQTQFAKLCLELKKQDCRPKLICIQQPNKLRFSELGKTNEERRNFVLEMFRNEYIKTSLDEGLKNLTEEDWELDNPNYKTSVLTWNVWADEFFRKSVRRIIEHPMEKILGRIYPWSLSGDAKPKDRFAYQTPKGDIIQFINAGTVSTPELFIQANEIKYKRYHDPILAAMMDMADLFKLFHKPVIPWVHLPGIYQDGIVTNSPDAKKAWTVLIETLSDNNINECLLSN